MRHRLRSATPARDTQIPTSRVDVEPQLDIARYHMIEVQINLELMNFSAVTVFLARVVGPETGRLQCVQCSKLKEIGGRQS